MPRPGAKPSPPTRPPEQQHRDHRFARLQETELHLLGGGCRVGEFLRLRGLVSWGGPDLPWNRRGQEQAAEIIAWGLMHRPAPIPTSVGDHGSQHPADLASAFVVLTGVAPPFDHIR